MIHLSDMIRLSDIVFLFPQYVFSHVLNDTVISCTLTFFSLLRTANDDDCHYLLFLGRAYSCWMYLEYVGSNDSSRLYPINFIGYKWELVLLPTYSTYIQQE